MNQCGFNCPGCGRNFTNLAKFQRHKNDGRSNANKRCIRAVYGENNNANEDGDSSIYSSSADEEGSLPADNVPDTGTGAWDDYDNNNYERPPPPSSINGDSLQQSSSARQDMDPSLSFASEEAVAHYNETITTEQNNVTEGYVRQHTNCIIHQS